MTGQLITFLCPQDQPQYFYVAEICHHLNPSSDFPGHGFETFEKYYGTKYGINIQNLGQPLLDVDHTSARLNFLTPRYLDICLFIYSCGVYILPF